MSRDLNLGSWARSAKATSELFRAESHFLKIYLNHCELPFSLDALLELLVSFVLQPLDLAEATFGVGLRQVRYGIAFGGLEENVVKPKLEITFLG